MTKKEMSEIFAVMLLAYPNAEIFRGGANKLAPTISLWTECCLDIDYWIGRQAVVLLCRECKYPPTIAEFRDKAAFITRTAKSTFDNRLNTYRLVANLKGADAAFAELRDGDPLKAAIAAVGGPNNLYADMKNAKGELVKAKYFKHYELEDAYMSAIRRSTELQGATRIKIEGGAQK